MRTLGRIAGNLLPLWLGVFCGAAFPNQVFADGNDKNEPKSAAKLEVPAPLTERERWLLDRLEQLEKRVAELEASRNVSAAPASDLEAPAATVLPSAEAPGFDAIAKNPEAAAKAVQATEQGKSATPKPQAAEPFSFAD